MKQDMSHATLPTINRNVLIVVPMEGFLEWARKYLDDDATLTLAELVADSTAYLIPEQAADAEGWLKRNFKAIFETEFDGSCADSSLWPKDRSMTTFRKFSASIIAPWL